MLLEILENIINETSLKKAETELKTNYSKEEFLKDTENDQYLSDEDKEDIISRNDSLEMFNKSGSKLNKNEIKEIISSSSLIQDLKSAYQSEGEYIQRLNDLSLENNLNIFIFLLYLNERNLTEDEINDTHVLFTNMNKEKNNLMNKVFAKNGLTSKPANEIDIDKIILDLKQAKNTLETNRENKSNSSKNKEQITNVVMLKGSEINGKIWVIVLPEDGSSSYKRGTIINPNEIDYSQGTAACSAEGKYGSHCGNSPRAGGKEMMFSLRSKSNLKEIFVTMTLDYDGKLTETQGKGNNEPNWDLLANNFTYLLDNNVIRKISFDHSQYKIENSFFVFKLKNLIPDDKFNSYMNNENLFTKFDEKMLNLVEDNKNKSEEEIFKDIFEYKYGYDYNRTRFDGINILTMKFIGYDQEMLLTKYRKQFLELIKKGNFFIENMALFDNKLILDQEVQDTVELKDGGVEFLLKHVVVNLNKKVNLKTVDEIAVDKYIFDEYGNIIFDGSKYDIKSIENFDDKYYEVKDKDFTMYLINKETKETLYQDLKLKSIEIFEDEYYKVKDKDYYAYLLNKKTKETLFKELELEYIYKFDKTYYRVQDKNEYIYLINKETKELLFKELKLNWIAHFDDKYYKVIDKNKEENVYLINKEMEEILFQDLYLKDIMAFDDKYYKVEDKNGYIYLINKETEEFLFKELKLKHIYKFDEKYFKVQDKRYNFYLINKETGKRKELNESIVLSFLENILRG